MPVGAPHTAARILNDLAGHERAWSMGVPVMNVGCVLVLMLDLVVAVAVRVLA